MLLVGLKIGSKIMVKRINEKSFYEDDEKAVGDLLIDVKDLNQEVQEIKILKKEIEMLSERLDFFGAQLNYFMGKK